MSAHNSLVASYANHHMAEATINRLHGAGFDESRLYVASRDGRAPEGATLIDAQDKLDETLYRLGIPRESVLDYDSEFAIDRVVLAAHGTAEEIDRAKRIIDQDHPDCWDGNVGCAIYYGCFD